MDANDYRVNRWECGVGIDQLFYEQIRSHSRPGANDCILSSAIRLLVPGSCRLTADSEQLRQLAVTVRSRMACSVV